MPPTTTPAFPPEIFGRILDHIAERGFEEPLHNSQVQDLRACSLVCHQFAYICQRRLFERINHVDSTDHARLHELQHILERSPALLGTVRELSFTISDPPVGEQLVDVEDLHLLLQFRGLISLAINVASTSFRIAYIPISLKFATAYMSQGTLQSLVLNGTMLPEMWPLLLESSSLHSLSIRFGTLICFSTVSNNSIKRLHLNMVSFMTGNASLLSRFTALEVLELEDVVVSGSGDQQCWIPSRNLISITMKSSSRYISTNTIILLDGLLCAIRHLPDLQQRTYLQNLNVIVASVFQERQLDILSSTLAIAHNITQFDITVNDAHADQHPSHIQRMGTEMRRRCYPLTQLRVNINLRTDPSTTFSATTSDLISLIDSVSYPGNTLELFSVDLWITFTSPEGFILNSWGIIADTLANASKFPKLRDVVITMVGIPLSPSIRRMLLQEFGGKEELKAALPRRMRSLGKRQGVNFEAKFTLE